MIDPAKRDQLYGPSWAMPPMPDGLYFKTSDWDDATDQHVYAYRPTIQKMGKVIHSDFDKALELGAESGNTGKSLTRYQDTHDFYVLLREYRAFLANPGNAASYKPYLDRFREFNNKL
ncbi:MAG TPA: hypothetical protein PKE06_28065 [Flavilitoribacter sp.]|nr:hypothetical protein [Flavilitoribacter sp.]HMQ91406.1 hypothetical protein [Flavilitoribacter sp.]